MKFIKLIHSKGQPKLQLAMPDGTPIPGCLEFKMIAIPGNTVIIQAEFMLDQESLPISQPDKYQYTISGEDIIKSLKHSREANL